MIKIHNKTFKPFISKENIAQRILELGQQIDIDYQNSSKPPIFIAILNGAFMFASDLMKVVKIESEVCFVKLKSYQGMQSAGEYKTAIGLNVDISGRDVIIIEDIVHTGKTLSLFTKQLQSHNPNSIEIVSCLFKPEGMVDEVKIKYCGFEIEDKFVVGYGLDYDELGRNIPEIYQLIS